MNEMLTLQRRCPRRAEHCIVERQQHAADAPIYILKDAAGSRYMKLSDEGLFVWRLMDGEHTIGDLCKAYFARFQPAAPVEVLRALARLHEAGFLRFQDVDDDSPPAAVTRGGTPRRLVSICTRYYYVSDFDRVATVLYRCLRALYTPVAQIALAVVACAGVIAFGRHVAASPVWTTAAMPGSLPVWLASLALQLVVHEAAHAATCKHFGRQVHRAGIGWYFFAPVAFVDTSDIWAAARLPRVLVSAAGPYSNLVLSGMAALAALLLAPDGWESLLWSFSFTGYVLALVNMNPLLELDGYYIVMDFLEIPNLRARALAYLGAVLRGRAREEPRQRRVFTLFGAASLAYGIAMGIGVLLAYRADIGDIASSYLPHWYAQAIGWVLAGTMSLAILHRLFDGLRLGQGRCRSAASSGGSTSTLSIPCRRAWTKIRMRCVLAARRSNIRSAR
jgi:putative peptide zinc metalloprotease protein